MGIQFRRRVRTAGRLKPQDHRHRRLLIILAALGAGLLALFGLAYSVARLDARNFDNQEQPQPSQRSQFNP